MLPNKKHLALLLALTLIFSLSAVFADKPSQEELDKLLAAQTDTSQILSPLIDAIEKGRQSVVGVNVYPHPPMGANYTEDDQGLGMGSGTVISPWGHVLTNAHVVEGAGGFAIVRDDKLTQAYLMDVDKDKDIAVLFAPGLKLPHVTFGDSDALKVGEWAIVIGNPMDHSMERTVMIGVISALDRAIESMPQEDKYGLETTTMQTMIQTDAAINPGMSGGGLFNSLGQLQGIPTMKIYEPAAEPGADQGEGDNAPVDGIGMCIPIKTALPMIQKVLAAYDGTDKPPQMEEEEVDGPSLGVMLADFDDRFPPRKAKRVPRGLFVEEPRLTRREGGLPPG